MPDFYGYAPDQQAEYVPYTPSATPASPPASPPASTIPGQGQRPTDGPYAGQSAEYIINYMRRNGWTQQGIDTVYSMRGLGSAPQIGGLEGQAFSRNRSGAFVGKDGKPIKGLDTGAAADFYNTFTRQAVDPYNAYGAGNWLGVAGMIVGGAGAGGAFGAPGAAGGAGGAGGGAAGGAGGGGGSLGGLGGWGGGTQSGLGVFGGGGGAGLAGVGGGNAGALAAAGGIAGGAGTGIAGSLGGGSGLLSQGSIGNAGQLHDLLGGGQSSGGGAPQIPWNAGMLGSQVQPQQRAAPQYTPLDTSTPMYIPSRGYNQHDFYGSKIWS